MARVELDDGRDGALSETVAPKRRYLESVVTLPCAGGNNKAAAERSGNKTRPPLTASCFVRRSSQGNLTGGDPYRSNGGRGHAWGGGRSMGGRRWW